MILLENLGEFAHRVNEEAGLHNEPTGSIPWVVVVVIGIAIGTFVYFWWKNRSAAAKQRQEQ